MLPPPDPPPDCGVPDGGLALLVPAGSPESPPPPIIPPSVEAVGIRDEEVKDCSVEVAVTDDEAADLVREMVKEVWLLFLVLLKDVANVVGSLVADECVDFEVGFVAVLEVLERRVLLPVEVVPDFDDGTNDQIQYPPGFEIDKLT